MSFEGTQFKPYAQMDDCMGNADGREEDVMGRGFSHSGIWVVLEEAGREREASEYSQKGGKEHLSKPQLFRKGEGSRAGGVRERRERR